MNRYSLGILILFPLLAQAGPYPGGNPYMGMDPQQMQRMASQMQKCMQQIDMSALEKMKTRAENMEREISSLCKNGQRNKAMEKGMAFAREINKTPELVKMRKCTSSMKGMMPDLSHYESLSKDKGKHSHICDDF